MAFFTQQNRSDSQLDFNILGVGGQIDFIRGAAQAEDGLGKPIIALHSATNKGETKIVPTLKNGAGNDV